MLDEVTVKQEESHITATFSTHTVSSGLIYKVKMVFCFKQYALLSLVYYIAWGRFFFLCYIFNTTKDKVLRISFHSTFFEKFDKKTFSKKKIYPVNALFIMVIIILNFSNSMVCNCDYCMCSFYCSHTISPCLLIESRYNFHTSKCILKSKKPDSCENTPAPKSPFIIIPLFCSDKRLSNSAQSLSQSKAIEYHDVFMRFWGFASILCSTTDFQYHP